MYYYYKMKNKIILLGILAIFIIIFLFYGYFFDLFTFTEGLANADPIDDKTRQVIMGYIEARKSPDNPDGSMTDEDIIKNVKLLGVNNAQINNILTTMKSAKDGVDQFASIFGQSVYDPLTDGLVIHYTFDKMVNKNGQNVFENKSRNHIPSNPANYDAAIYQGAKNPQAIDTIIDKKQAVVNPSCLYLNGLPRSDPATGGSTDNGAYLKIPTVPTCYDDTGFLGMSYSVWSCATDQNGNWSRIFDFANNRDNDNIVMTPSTGYDQKLGCCIVNNHWNPYQFYWGDYDCDSNWRHIVWSISKLGKWTIYVNGKVVSDNLQLIPKNVVRKRNYIGKSNWNQTAAPPADWDDAFSGWIDDFRMYRRELTKDDVTALYNKGSKVVQQNNSFWVMPDTQNQWYENKQGGRVIGKIRELGILSNTQMTIAFWLNIPKTFNNWRNVFIISNNSANVDSSRVPSLYIYPHTTQLHFRFATLHNGNDGMGDGNPNWDPTYQLPLGKDVHVTYTIQGKTIQFYVNGVLNYSRTFPSSTRLISNNSATQLYMAVYHNCQGVKLKNFQIFNRSLLPEEVLRVYSQLTCDY